MTSHEIFSHKSSLTQVLFHNSGVVFLDDQLHNEGHRTRFFPHQVSLRQKEEQTRGLDRARVSWTWSSCHDDLDDLGSGW